MSKTSASKVRDYIVNVLNGMAWGLFSSLLIGLIIRQIGTIVGNDLLIHFGNVAQRLMGPAIAVGVAYAVKAPNLGIMSAVAVGALNRQRCLWSHCYPRHRRTRETFVAARRRRSFKLVASKTKVDIVIVPFVTIAVGGLVAHFISPAMSA